MWVYSRKGRPGKLLGGGLGKGGFVLVAEEKFKWIRC